MLLEKKSGDRICQCMLLKLQKIGQTNNGNIFSRGIVQDNSGVINFISFDRQVTEIIKNSSNPCAIKAFGVIQPDKYSSDGGVQFLLEKVEILDKEADISSLMPITTKDIEKYKIKLKKIINEIKKSYYKQLLINIFEPKILEKFSSNPAAMKLHHAYIGGLLEHSVEVASIVRSLVEVVDDIEVDWDMAITGALLHDIGKIEELSSNIGFDYTDSGRMLGHIMIGVIFIKKIISEIKDFPELESNKLLHVIVSHHGTQDKGSPTVCVTPESFIVHYADEINVTLNQFYILEKNNKSHWQYSKMLNRQLWIT